jgi:DNA-binding transcriptional MerR regulator
MEAMAMVHSYKIKTGINLAQPGWRALYRQLSQRDLTSKDLKTILGLTYRQINDWQTRGLLPSIQEQEKGLNKGAGWKKFSFLELIPLAILGELKKNGFSISRLREPMKLLYLSDDLLLDVIPDLVNGNQILFYTDFYNVIGFKTFKTIKDYSEITFSFPTRSIEKNNFLITGLYINNLIGSIFKKSKLPNFSAEIDKNGKYRFQINGVPLALEEIQPSN